jgi:hypothetical protein
MKKFYISLIGLLTFGSSFAQMNSISPLNKKNSQMIGQVKSSKEISTEKAVVLWSDDFSTAGNWAIENNGTNVGVWEITNDPTVIPVAALAPMASSTASNGFLFVNSDANNTVDNDGTQIITTATNVTPIDLTGQPNVKLIYEHNFRWYKDTRGVRVSGNNGLTWTDFEMSNVTDYTTPNQNSDNPEVTTIDISSVAGGQSQVLVQFYYDDNDIWAWYWAVDDVKIVVTDDYDLTLNSAYWGSTGFWGTRLPYYQIPTAQIAPIDFAGIVKNSGVMTQSDIVFTAAIPSLYAGVSAPYSLALSQFDTLPCSTQFTPTASAATHTVTFATTSAATEAFAADNTIAPITISVNNVIYARDAGVIENGSYNAGDGFEAGNIFDIVTTSEVSAIDVVIGSTAVAGAEIFVKLYSIDPTNGDFIYMDESFPYTLATANLGQKITLALQNAQILNAGESYLAVVGSVGDAGASNDLVVATSGTSEANTSYYYDATDLTWYYTTNTPMVRLNFSPASINEVSSNFGLNVYPNPANTSATISMALSNEANVVINVTDLSGKVVYTNALGKVNGAQKITVNTDSLSSGVYMVNLSVDGAVSTQKLVVRK